MLIPLATDAYKFGTPKAGTAAVDTNIIITKETTIIDYFLNLLIYQMAKATPDSPPITETKATHAL